MADLNFFFFKLNDNKLLLNNLSRHWKISTEFFSRSIKLEVVISTFVLPAGEDGYRAVV